MDFWLICYDIADDRRRDRVASWLLRHGNRVQESVFEAQLRNETHFQSLWRGVAERITAPDQVRAYPVGVASLKAVRCLGSDPPQAAAYATVI